MLRTNFASYRMPMFNAEGGSGGGGDTPAGGVKPAPETVLFPKDGEKPAGTSAGGKEEGDGEKPAEWKEYVNDPAKSEADNAAAKVEHDKTKPAPAADADKVPDDGKYEPKMPDGVQIDQGMMDAISPALKEAGVTRAGAQKIIDAFVATQQARAEEHAKSPEGAWSMSQYEYFKANGTPDKWPDTAKADKDMGGAKWDGTVKNAQRAINKLGSAGLKEYLTASGGGNHPELIRFAAKAGALIAEDDPAGGDGGQSKPADAAHLLFPSDAPKG